MNTYIPWVHNGPKILISPSGLLDVNPHDEDQEESWPKPRSFWCLIVHRGPISMFRGSGSAESITGYVRLKSVGCGATLQVTFGPKKDIPWCVRSTWICRPPRTGSWPGCPAHLGQATSPQAVHKLCIWRLYKFVFSAFFLYKYCDFPMLEFRQFYYF